MYMLSTLIFYSVKIFFFLNLTFQCTVLLLYQLICHNIWRYEDSIVAMVTVKLKIFTMFQLTVYKLWKFCCVLRCCGWEGNSRVCHHPMMGCYLHKFYISDFTYWKILFSVLERHYSKVKEVCNHFKVFLI